MKKISKVILPGLTALTLAGSILLSMKGLNNPLEAKAFSGSGTAESPYILSDLDDFNKFRNIVNGTGGETKNTGACAKLAANINLNNTSSDQTIQLGSESSPYNGTFDGDGYTINNMYIDTGTNDTLGGLFKYTGADADIKNFSINGTVKSKKPCAVVGVNKGIIENVTNRANITVNYCGGSYTDYRAGGIAAENAGGIIRHCNNYGTIYSYNYGGGIVGKAYFSETSTYGYIEHCVNYGLVSIAPEDYTWSGQFIGGIAGISVGNYIVECIHAGEVYGEVYIAGILGQMSDDDNDNHPHIIDRCLSIGTVKSEYESSTYRDGIGAILGKVEDGNIIDNDPDNKKFLYRNYYLQGSVSQEPGTTVINNCGYGETNSTNVGTGHRDLTGQAQGLTADQIKVKSNFKNWTFGDFYEMGKNYPLSSSVAVQECKETIAEIGEVTFTPECLAKIELAETLYNGFSQTHKDEVSNYSDLTNARATYNALAAESFESLVDAIVVGEYSSANIAKIGETKALYQELTQAQKDLITPSKMEKYNNAVAVYNIEEKIVAIGEVDYTAACNALITAARSAYDGLTPAELKDLVANYDVLLAAEARYNELANGVDDAIALIDAIGEVTFTTDSKDRIDDARKAYDALTDGQKNAVPAEKVSILTGAEATYAELEAAGSGTRSDDTNGVSVVTDDGTKIQSNITLTVEVRADVKAEEGSAEREAIQAKLASDEAIAKVFDVKLIKNEGGVETEIQPSDIKEGMKLIVEITVPSDVSTEGLKILHIHSESEMEFIESYELADGKVSFEVSKLSEMAFINKVDAPVPPTPVDPSGSNNFPGWGIALIIIGAILLLGCLGYLFLFFALNKWIKEGDKALRAFVVSKKEGRVKVMVMPFKFMYRDESEIYNSKEDALR